MLVRLIGFCSFLGLLLAACVAGPKAPTFTLPDAGGGTVSLSDYSGRPVLLYFHMAVG